MIIVNVSVLTKVAFSVRKCVACNIRILENHIRKLNFFYPQKIRQTIPRST